MSYVCVECGTVVDALYSTFPGSTNIRIEHCKNCGQPADSYIEYDVSLILLDMMLLSKPVWRHVLFNVDTKYLHWKLAVVCMFCDGYMKWVIAAKSERNQQSLANANELVFQAAVQIQLYVHTFVSCIELAMFLCLSIFLYCYLEPIISKHQNLFSVHIKPVSAIKILRCLLLASTGKFLYIPAIIWMQADSTSYLQLILLYVVLCSSLSLSLTIECSFFQAFVIIMYSFFLSILFAIPISKWLYSLDLHLHF